MFLFLIFTNAIFMKQKNRIQFYGPYGVIAEVGHTCFATPEDYGNGIVAFNIFKSEYSSAWSRYNYNAVYYRCVDGPSGMIPWNKRGLTNQWVDLFHRCTPWSHSCFCITSDRCTNVYGFQRTRSRRKEPNRTSSWQCRWTGHSVHGRHVRSYQ